MRNILLLILPFFLFGCSSQYRATTKFPIATSVNDLSPEEEYRFGRAVSAKILSIYPLSHNKKLNRYVNLVGHTVAASSGRPETFHGYTFAVLDSDKVDAVSAPGGFVFITRGMLKRLQNEDELASVLAHEVTHISSRDGLLALSRHASSKGFVVGGKLVSAIDCSSLSALLGAAFDQAVEEFTNTLLQAGYSQEMEFAADHGAQAIAAQAGYDQNALSNVLTSLITNESRGGWFDTHPASSDRLARLGTGPSNQTVLARTARFEKNVKN